MPNKYIAKSLHGACLCVRHSSRYAGVETDTADVVSWLSQLVDFRNLDQDANNREIFRNLQDDLSAFAKSGGVSKWNIPEGK